MRIVKSENAFRQKIASHHFPQNQIGAFYKWLHQYLDWTIKTQIRSEKTDPLALGITLPIAGSGTASQEGEYDRMTLDDFLDQTMSVDTKNTAKRQMDRIMGKDDLRKIKELFGKVKDGPLLFKALDMYVYRQKSVRAIAAATRLKEHDVRKALRLGVNFARRIALDLDLPRKVAPLLPTGQTAESLHGTPPPSSKKKRRAKLSQRVQGLKRKTRS